MSSKKARTELGSAPSKRVVLVGKQFAPVRLGVGGEISVGTGWRILGEHTHPSETTQTV